MLILLLEKLNRHKKSILKNYGGALSHDSNIDFIHVCLAHPFAIIRHDLLFLILFGLFVVPVRKRTPLVKPLANSNDSAKRKVTM